MKELIIKGRIDIDLIKELKDIHDELEKGKDEYYLEEWRYARQHMISGREQLGRLLLFLNKINEIKEEIKKEKRGKGK